MNPIDKPVYLHLGLHKTATKFWQLEVFPKFSGIRDVSRRECYPDFTSPVLKADAISFKRLVPDLRKFIADRAGDEERILLSDELFSGNPFYGYVNRFDLVWKLKELFPSAKVILSIRGQRSIIDSLYREYVAQGGTARFEELVQPRRNILSIEPILDLNAFYYGDYLDALSDAFGKENMMIFPYERMKGDFDGVLNDFLTFLGIKDLQKGLDIPWKERHRSISDSALLFKRRVNRFCKSIFNPGGYIPYKWNPAHLFKYFDSAKVDRGGESRVFGPDNLLERYAKDNQRVDEEYQLKLKERHATHYFP